MQYDSVASDLFMSRRNDQGNFFYQFHETWKKNVLISFLCYKIINLFFDATD